MAQGASPDLAARSLATAYAPMASASVSFVCEPGRLEAQALLLAASLRSTWPELELVAAVPRALPAATTQALAALRVTELKITNPLASDYPIGNKLAALGIGAGDGLRVFLDSDMLCLGGWDWRVLTSHPLAAKPSDLATFGSDALWRELYARFALAPPTQRVLSTVSQQLMHPYFNAGMLATTRAAELAAEWAQICLAIDAMQDIHPRRPWLDQIGLPIAAARLGLAVRSLGEAWNYPAHIKPLLDVPSIVHYHVPAVIAREPALVERVAALLAHYPPVAAVVQADAAWQPVAKALELHAARAARRSRKRWFVPSASRLAAVPAVHAGVNARDLIITGLPRSGTSYLCKALDGFSNVAVINEPEALFEGLRWAPEPWAVPLLHADLRARINAGEAVANKLDARGELTDDTALHDTRAPYRPQLRDEHWLLATKNTLAYLARLDGIMRLMPQAHVLACVRHPLDTLASWKGTFAHLAKGDPASLPVGGLADPYLPAHLRQGIEALLQMDEPAMRRAAWWSLLANEILRWRGRIVVVRYEDLVAAPAATIERALGLLHPAAGEPAAPLQPSRVRLTRRQALDASDWQAVASLCASPAEAFGYDCTAQPQDT
jgi:hypothetical protein